jgi:hypothetical protein
MVAALTPLPVIGVPVRASALDGLDSLLSIVQVYCFSTFPLLIYPKSPLNRRLYFSRLTEVPHFQLLTVSQMTLLRPRKISSIPSLSSTNSRYDANPEI